jgi:hypothetical protein
MKRVPCGEINVFDCLDLIRKEDEKRHNIQCKSYCSEDPPGCSVVCDLQSMDININQGRSSKQTFRTFTASWIFFSTFFLSYVRSSVKVKGTRWRVPPHRLHHSEFGEILTLNLLLKPPSDVHQPQVKKDVGSQIIP